jgi:heme exporter protein D
MRALVSIACRSRRFTIAFSGWSAPGCSFYNLRGVVWLMIGLLVIQIAVVWAWGVEPRNRGLEDVAKGAAVVGA